MRPRPSCRGWGLSLDPTVLRRRCFNVAAALVPRMDEGGLLRDATETSFNVAATTSRSRADIPASMWPRLSCRGWTRAHGSDTAHHRASMWPRLSCRGWQIIRNVLSSPCVASMWPRLSCRGWSGMWYPPGGRRSGFNVAAALVPRMVPEYEIGDRVIVVLQCGRGSRAADGDEGPDRTITFVRASMWPRLSCRGWGRSISWRKGVDRSFNVAAALVPRMECTGAALSLFWGLPASVWPVSLDEAVGATFPEGRGRKGRLPWTTRLSMRSCLA